MKKIILLMLFAVVNWQHSIAQAQVPDAATNLVATGINTGGMIQFTAPTSDGGSPITNYEYSTDNGSTWITPSPAITTSPLIISSGLTNCTSYQVKIRAVNAVGSGSASSAVQLIPATSAALGVNWTQRASAADNDWSGIAYGNGLFVAVAATGTGNRVMTSPDGITWTARTSAADNNWKSVTYGNGLFVAVASSGVGNRVMTSPDGITWTIRTSAADNNWVSVTYGNGLFVAVAQTGTVNRVMTSPDGITWTIRTFSNNQMLSVIYANGLFMAMSSNGTKSFISTSTDGINWASGPSISNLMTSITYGNGSFIAVTRYGVGNRVLTSTDGLTWTSRTSAADNDWQSVTFNNGLFVAVANTGTGNRVMTSSNGINWTARTSAADSNWTSVTYGNGVFVAVASSGSGNRVMTSSYSSVADAPVITSAPFGSSRTVNFTQSSAAYAPAISNYQYSIDNGSNWTAVSPAATTSPLTITGLSEAASSIMLRAVNSVGNSCPSNNICLPPSAPTASAQTFCSSKTVADLVATGTDLKWYDVATNGTALASTTAIASGTYYVSQTLNSCESNRTSVSVTVSQQPTQPTIVNPWDNYVFNSTTCSWDYNVMAPTVLTNFNSFKLSLSTSDFIINAPNSNSTGAITYTSSNPNVATINGTIIHLVAPGTTIITATQASDGNYMGNSISTSMSVSPFCGDWGYILNYPN